MATLLPYAKFHHPDEAAFLIGLLQHANIPFQWEQEVNQLDDIIIGYSLDPMYILFLEEGHFPIVNKLLEEKGEGTGEKETADYLHQMCDDELKAVIQHPEEWNAFDQGRAKMILKERGVSFTENKEESSLSFAPESIPVSTLIAGYLLSTTLIGVLFGLSILQNKKVLPNGQKVHRYDKESRQHATLMIVVALFAATYILYRILR